MGYKDGYKIKEFDILLVSDQHALWRPLAALRPLLRDCPAALRQDPLLRPPGSSTANMFIFSSSYLQ